MTKTLAHWYSSESSWMVFENLCVYKLGHTFFLFKIQGSIFFYHVTVQLFFSRRFLGLNFFYQSSSLLSVCHWRTGAVRRWRTAIAGRGVEAAWSERVLDVLRCIISLIWGVIPDENSFCFEETIYLCFVVQGCLSDSSGKVFLYWQKIHHFLPFFGVQGRLLLCCGMFFEDIQCVFLAPSRIAFRGRKRFLKTVKDWPHYKSYSFPMICQWFDHILILSPIALTCKLVEPI